jgi:hypothetical protein
MVGVVSRAIGLRPLPFTIETRSPECTRGAGRGKAHRNELVVRHGLRRNKGADDFIDFCRSEGRFAKHFDKEGNPSEVLLTARQDRLENWRLLQELAGLV